MTPALTKPALLCALLLLHGAVQAQEKPAAPAPAVPAPAVPAPAVPAPAVPAPAVPAPAVPAPAVPAPAIPAPAPAIPAQAAAPPATGVAAGNDAASGVAAGPMAGGDAPWAPYATMRRALLVFEREHALAPDAEARFELRAQTPAASLDGLRLQLAQDADTRTYLPVMADGTFSLPDNARNPKGAAALVLNRPAGQWLWRPSVRSSGVPRHARRLGDLRLECRMLWALEADPAKASSAGGPCVLDGAAPAFPAPQSLAAATLTTETRRMALRLGTGGATYLVPLADRSWPDSALLYFDFAAPATP